MKLYILPFIALLSCNSSMERKQGSQTIKDSLAGETDPYFQAIRQNDVKMEKPQPGDWLSQHPEAGQSFEVYKNSNPTRTHRNEQSIFLEPLGKFTPLQMKVLELTREYIAIFYQQKTVLLPSTTDKSIPANARRQGPAASEQLLTTYILDSMLKHNIPKNGFVLMAITEKDLYPQPDWNYVFGMAYYTDRVGVSSIYRLQDQQLDTANFTRCLKRLINVAAHEIGHMCSMPHCIFAKCVMNGSNNLPESDRQPNRLCSECQRKLFWNSGYDNVKRLKELAAFMERNKLVDDLALLKLDLEKIK